MTSFLREFPLTFIPLFIAIDALGTIPVILPLAQEAQGRLWRRIVALAVLTAAAVGLLFMAVGKAILDVLGVSVDHFAVAGGLILLVMAMRDITTGKLFETPEMHELVAVVPIGTPLLAGPATITTLLLLSQRYPWASVLAAFALNMALAWLIFRYGPAIGAFLGQGGLRAVSKVASLLLAAIAVRMVVQGIQALFTL